MMATPFRIFIGSSSEATSTAQKLESLIYDIGKDAVTVKSWWNADVFPPGATFIESLRAVMESTDAALLVATPDDKQIKRGSESFIARDNVILECGMSIAAHGPGRTVLAVVGKPELPTDLAGVTDLPLQQGDDFNGRNRGRVEPVIRRWLGSTTSADGTTRPNLPKLYEAILRVVGEFKPDSSGAEGVDLMAASLLDSIAQHFSDSSAHRGITNLICNTSADHLVNADAIWATDVLGPSAWLTPTAFRYLAIQIREYFRANTIRSKIPFKFSCSVGKALRRASDNIKKRTGQQSATKFDDQFFTDIDKLSDHSFRWTEGEMELEFARVLLWTEDELRSRITESVSNIHEAFHVPLFALLVRPETRRREFDFIAFRQRDDKSLRGFYSKRNERFYPQPMADGHIPGYGSCQTHWEEIFSHPDLMFAADLHHLLHEGRRVEPML